MNQSINKVFDYTINSIIIEWPLNDNNYMIINL